MKPDKKKIWLIHGYQEVIKGGFYSLNVDALSTRVGIAKTSFYQFYNSMMPETVNG